MSVGDTERLYRDLFEGIATAVTVRSLEDQTFLECNQAALRLYRAPSVDALRGSRVAELSGEFQPDGKTTAEALQDIVTVSTREGKVRREWLARRVDGSLFLADIRVAILELESGRRVMQTLIEDITERKAAQEALEKRARRDELVGQISRRFLEMDVESSVRFASESFGAFLGVGADVVSEWVAGTMPPDLRGLGDDAGGVRILR